ncbi:bifunctional 4-hydroxy-2-oxoglutarate aldolase/2-dehydro-3-deoxy-phosphogluconate aldolase [Sphingobacterium sp. Mn56C]|uniref:bifunctional 4-hydroxy-2-oxoglutarate aldolase/2-dehydro-3-deoxy-phosphogluconate aldolase n=1 Tax=Sphingobacterium sp. Mn56C TaxID=3395261 RepID=UPI003BC1ED06
MMQTTIIDKIKAAPVIPVFYHDDLEYCKAVLSQSYAGGIRVFEFVNRGAAALRNFEALMAFKQAHYPDLALGIGTIKNAQQVADFAALGAEFIVSPIIDAAVVAAAKAHSLYWIPGCMTPTEIAFAESLGADLVKLFPGDVLGPQFLKAIKPLFPNLKFMPTGGVDVTELSIKSWRDAGVFAVGLGSKLFAAPESTALNDSWLQDRVSKVLHFCS